MKRDPGKEAEQTERIFSALSHRSRRQILLTLQFRGGEMSAGDIAKRFSCSWPTTTRHLNILLESGIVTVDKIGRERIYKLQRDLLQKYVGEWLAWFDD